MYSLIILLNVYMYVLRYIIFNYELFLIIVVLIFLLDK